MSVTTRALAVAALLAAAQTAGAQDAAGAVTWKAAVDAAWQRSVMSAETAGAARKAQAERATASALWAAPPALEVGQIRDRQRAGRSTRETEVGLAVPLWLPGQRAARLGATDAEEAAASAAAAAARLRVAGAVREAAWDLALQRGELAAAEVQDRELHALAKDVERRVAAGDLARADALAAQAERLAGAAALAQARQRVQVALANWNALTGLTVTPDTASDAPAAAAPPEHPALREAALRVGLARSRLDLVKASRRDAPELLVRARQEVASGEPHSNGIGIAIRVPFGSADRNEPLLAAALSEQDVALAAERELRFRLEAELASARNAEATARSQLADETARARLLRERAGLVQKSFRAGETSLPETLRALTAAAQAEASALRQQAVLGQAIGRIEQASGVTP